MIWCGTPAACTSSSKRVGSGGIPASCWWLINSKSSLLCAARSEAQGLIHRQPIAGFVRAGRLDTRGHCAPRRFLRALRSLRRLREALAEQQEYIGAMSDDGLAARH